RVLFRSFAIDPGGADIACGRALTDFVDGHEAVTSRRMDRNQKTETQAVRGQRKDMPRKGRPSGRNQLLNINRSEFHSAVNPQPIRAHAKPPSKQRRKQSAPPAGWSG